MTLSQTQVSFPDVAWLAALLVLAAALVAAIRRYLLPARPASAATAATAVLVLGDVLSSLAGVLTSPFALALAPAAAMVATAEQPLAAAAWLRGAATLAVVLTLISVLVSETLTTMYAGAATSGVLCFLLGRGSATGSSS